MHAKVTATVTVTDPNRVRPESQGPIRTIDEKAKCDRGMAWLVGRGQSGGRSHGS